MGDDLIFTSMASVEPSQQETVVIPASKTHTATVIFVHGLGQNTATWRDMILEGLVPNLPNVEWVIPQASDKDVSYEHRRRPAWFNITALPPGPDEFDENAITESIGIIEDLILSQVHRGIDASKIVLVGFSQGAALSLMVALWTLHDLGGVASLAGWIPLKAKDQPIASPNFPVLWCHGLADELIPTEHAEDVVAYLNKNLKGPVQFEKYPGLGHTINAAMVATLLAWLTRLCM
ncbi:Acyl-protein thioesterase 1 [Mycena kentingensis (nom. inval.)]|nr:Acyl-protein thioesterase 1 [Mycena kentingensis (nom. inval.)]